MRTRGTSAIEVIIYVAVFTLVSMAIMSMTRIVYKTHSFVNSQIVASADIRKSMETMSSLLRKATYSDAGAFPVESMGYNQIVFYANADTDPNIERVRFFLQGNDLVMGVINSSGTPATYNPSNEVLKVISHNVYNTDMSINLFNFFDKDGNAITDLSDLLSVRTIKITLTVDNDPNKAPNSLQVSTRATVRNIINSYENNQ